MRDNSPLNLKLFYFFAVHDYYKITFHVVIHTNSTWPLAASTPLECRLVFTSNTPTMKFARNIPSKQRKNDDFSSCYWPQSYQIRITKGRSGSYETNDTLPIKWSFHSRALQVDRRRPASIDAYQAVSTSRVLKLQRRAWMINYLLKCGLPWRRGSSYADGIVQVY